MRLKIDQSFARIGLKQNLPRTKVEQKPADFKLQKLPGKLEINSKATRVKIGQTKARADLNHKNYKIFSKEIAKEGMKNSYKAIATYAREGDQLAAIEKGGQPIVEQAVKHAYEKKREIELKWKHGPEYQVVPGKLAVKWNSSKVKLRTKPNWPHTDFQWGKVEIYQKQLPELKIRVVNEKV